MRNLLLILAITTVLITGCDSDDNNTYSLTVDNTNYNLNTQLVFNTYNNDPIIYFAENGIIALTNQYDILSAVGHDPIKAFQPMLNSFEEVQATQAKNNNIWAANFINKMNEINAQPIIEQWLYAILFYARQANDIKINNPTDPNLGVLYSYLGEGVRHAIHPNYFLDIQPPSTSPASYDFTIYNEFCICQMFSPVTCSDPVDTSQNVQTDKIPWRTVGESFKTTCDGKCAALSTGLCLQKLGVIDSLVDGQTWYRISAEIQAEQKGGAYNENISAYFERLGFGVTKSNDIRDAYLALNRGCDAKIVYHDGSTVGGKQHIEYITHIQLTSPSLNQGIVNTISWGDSSNVNYDSGNFSGKSDGASYGSEDFLAGTGKSHFLIYCKK